MKLKNYALLLPLVFLFACISADRATTEDEAKKQEVYVFDDIPKVEQPKAEVEEKKAVVKEEKVVESPIKIEQAPQITNLEKKFTVQLGAFSSKEKADVFVKEHQAKTSLTFQIKQNLKNNLFVVQIPPYATKAEADLIRDNLRKFPAFADCFSTVIE